MVDSYSFVIRSHKHQYLSQAYTHRQLLSRVYGLVDQRTLDGYARWRKSPLPSMSCRGDPRGRPVNAGENPLSPPCHVGAGLAPPWWGGLSPRLLGDPRGRPVNAGENPLSPP